VSVVRRWAVRTRKELEALWRAAKLYALSDYDGVEDPPFDSPADFAKTLKSAQDKLEERMRTK